MDRFELFFESKIRARILEESLDEPKSRISPKSLNKKTYALNAYEWERIREVRHAMESSFEDERTLPVIAEATDLFAALDIPEIYLRKVAKLCHKITGFKYIKPNDQIVIFKQFFCESMFVRHTFQYDVERDGFYIYGNDAGDQAIFIPWDKCYCFKSQEIVSENRNYGTRLYEEMEQDPIIRDLLTVQLLFRSRESVSCVEFLKYYHIRYCLLLRRYLQHKLRNKKLANKRYLTIRQLLARIDIIRTNERTLLVREIDCTHIPHILYEIYNL